MNTPKTRRRASLDPAELPRDTPAILYHPISDPVAAYIGHVATAYTSLERKMIGVFRVILGIESGEAAALAYTAIKSPKVRWDIARQVLENDHGHAHTSPDYDELIDEFRVITNFRNRCLHGAWWLDSDDQPWLSETATPVGLLSPVRFRKSEFDKMLECMRELDERITAVAQQDQRRLDRRWLARRQHDHDNSS